MLKMDTSQFLPLDVPSAPAVLAFKNLTVSVRKNNYDILHGVSGTITGGFWGILGASGSGKTSFLNALARRLDTARMTLKGDITLNGKPYTNRDLKACAGYVMQDDLLHVHLTVKETLDYCAELRMPSITTAQERRDRVHHVINLMGLHHCQDVIVGDSLNKGISGGERKRLAIGVELINQPRLLFLDEPTSGLDSVTALALSRTLKRLADSGVCTVICTIHQPQTKIFEKLDNLIIMKQGHIFYQGRADRVIDFYAAAGFPLARGGATNPADHILDCITPEIDALESGAMDADVVETHTHSPTLTSSSSSSDGLIDLEAGLELKARVMSGGDSEGSNDAEERGAGGDIEAPLTRRSSKTSTSHDNKTIDHALIVTNKDVQLFDTTIRREGEDGDVDVWKGDATDIKFSGVRSAYRAGLDIDLTFGHDKPCLPPRIIQPFHRQIYILFRRCMWEHVRNWKSFCWSMLVSMTIAVLFGEVFYHIGQGQDSLTLRLPALFFCVINQGVVASLQGTHSFPAERALMLRERAAGTYMSSSYFIAKSLADSIQSLPATLTFGLIAYYMVGFEHKTSKIVIFQLFMILDALAATSLATAISSWCGSIQFAVTIIPLAFEVSRLFGGFFLPPADLPTKFVFLDALSYIKYTYIGVANNELIGITYDCTANQIASHHCVKNGDGMIALKGFDQFTIGQCAGILILFIFGTRLLGYLGLRFNKY